MLGCDEAGFAAIQAIALNAAIRGSILAVPDACFVMMMALPFGFTRAVATALHTQIRLLLVCVFRCATLARLARSNAKVFPPPKHARN